MTKLSLGFPKRHAK